MYKTAIIKGNTDTDYQDNLNRFFAKNKNIKIVDIKHFYKNFDFFGIITYRKEVKQC